MTNEKTSAAKKRAASKKQKRLQPAIRQVTEVDPNGSKSRITEPSTRSA